MTSSKPPFPKKYISFSLYKWVMRGEPGVCSKARLPDRKIVVSRTPEGVVHQKAQRGGAMAKPSDGDTAFLITAISDSGAHVAREWILVGVGVHVAAEVVGASKALATLVADIPQALALVVVKLRTFAELMDERKEFAGDTKRKLRERGGSGEGELMADAVSESRLLTRFAMEILQTAAEGGEVQT
ncbi:hypothetical protein HDU82_001717 [Entophlyctis luteolus]|nr:hypothetical protein HDU82_001717 [Entophlyctis luteolus]